MTESNAFPPKPVRVWPAAVIVSLLLIGMFVPKYVDLGVQAQVLGVFMGPMIAAGLMLIWWVGFSRASWTDRLLVLGALAVGAAILIFLGDPSMTMMLTIYPLPTVLAAWGLWLVVTPGLSWPLRRGVLLALIVGVCGLWTLVQFTGTTGTFEANFRWRWSPRLGDAFDAYYAGKTPPAPKKSAEPPLTLTQGDWPGFRGLQRDGRLPGVRIATNWDANPPKLLWKHPVGPGWGSFAVIGKNVYTQEQRKDDEVVVCYNADTGEEVWVHADKVRFTEPIAGPGPRSTPTFHEGKLYTLGANGQLNCLDARTGEVIWSRDIAKDSEAKIPQWGFSASPLVVDGLVTVFTGAKDKAVAAYDAKTGEPKWSAGPGKDSYSSLHHATIEGVEQILIATDRGLTSLAPKTGETLWHHEWPIDGMARITQPALVSNSDILVGTGFDNGLRRIHITKSAEKPEWTSTTKWTSPKISPYFNDFVVHKDHVYGFHNKFFTCVSLDTGKTKWRARGYDAGQALLLPDQDLLVILAEDGKVALVEATPTEHKEIASFEAIKGITWNHPVIAHGRLFVRNGEEAACFVLKGER